MLCTGFPNRRRPGRTTYGWGCRVDG